MNELCTIVGAALTVVFVVAAGADGETTLPAPPEPISGTHRDYVDFVGPDGLVYPDFTFAGVTGGIPEVRGPVFPVGMGKGAGTDQQDDHPAIQAAVDAAAKAGGGVVTIPAGTWMLDRPVRIASDGVVIRGAGRDATTVVFRDSPAENVGAFDFSGAGRSSADVPLVATAPRGGMEPQLADAAGIKLRDFIALRNRRFPDELKGKFAGEQRAATADYAWNI